MKTNTTISVMLTVFSFCYSALGEERFVSPAGNNIAPYSNWEDAAHVIQDAIDVSISGDFILVDTGTYHECISFMGKDISLASLYHTTSNKSYIAQTVIDAGALCAVVTLNGGETTNALLCGFTITNGLASGSSAAGGGIYCHASSPRLENLHIMGNQATAEGGGMFLSYSYSPVKNVSFIGNRATSHGGAVRVSYGKPSFHNVEITGNHTSADGGGMNLYHTDSPMQNILIADNHANSKGGGMFFDFSNPELENMTIANNAGAPGGGLNVSYNSHPKLINSIVWGNSPTQIVYDTQWGGMALTIEYSDVEGGENGIQTFNLGPVHWLEGNLSGDPQFAGAGQFTIVPGSVCLNAGTNRDWMSMATDLNGDPRVSDARVDMGAYENTNWVGVSITVPDLPIGSEVGAVNDSLAYATGGSSCSDGSTVLYRFDWDDGQFSEWSELPNALHSWNQIGTYQVKAQSRSASNEIVISSWSQAISVTITQELLPALIHYVSPAGNDTPPYTNWTMAAHRIQDAINIAVDGATVLVGPAIYTENINYFGKQISVGSLYMMTADGGYINQTVIDGGASARVVTFAGGETTNSLLCGFTLTNGFASGAQASGGGIYCHFSSPRLENLHIMGNTAADQGGGMYLVFSSAMVRDVLLSGNIALSHGGGIRVSYGKPDFFNLEIVGNHTGADGGGINLYHTDSPMRNILMANNHANIKGGGLFFDASSPVMENITVTGNSGSLGGGLNVSYNSHPVLINSIVWGNEPSQIIYDTQWGGMSLTIEYSDIEGGVGDIQTFNKGPVHWLAGNMNADPLFAENFSLQAESPGIDAGTNKAWMLAEVDLRNSTRIENGSVDLGALEHQTSTPGNLGSISCRLYPDQASDLGAAWRLTTGPHTDWNISQAVLRNIPEGEYTVEFKSLDFWTTPSSLEVLIIAGMTTNITGDYTPWQLDSSPPVFVDVFPPDGYVGQSNHVYMVMVVTDNVGVASVFIDKKAATAIGSNSFEFTTTGVRGSHNPQLMIATDLAGNRTTQTVVYGMGENIQLRAMWDGYWRITNPFAININYTWTIDGSSEAGEGIALAHRYHYFNTSTGDKVLRLWVDGILVDVKHSSNLPEPVYVANENDIDSDLDGFSNLEEEIAGTDVNDGDSLFTMKLNTGTQASKLFGVEQPAHQSFKWQSGIDSLYTMHISTNLNDWVVIQDFAEVPGTGEIMSYSINIDYPVFFLRLSAGKKP